MVVITGKVTFIVKFNPFIMASPTPLPAIGIPGSDGIEGRERVIRRGGQQFGAHGSRQHFAPSPVRCVTACAVKTTGGGVSSRRYRQRPLPLLHSAITLLTTDDVVLDYAQTASFTQVTKPVTSV